MSVSVMGNSQFIFDVCLYFCPFLFLPFYAQVYLSFCPFHFMSVRWFCDKTLPNTKLNLLKNCFILFSQKAFAVQFVIFCTSFHKPLFSLSLSLSLSCFCPMVRKASSEMISDGLALH